MKIPVCTILSLLASSDGFASTATRKNTVFMSPLFVTKSTVSSASTYVGAGNALVDMNDYNIPFERSVEEWAANLKPQSATLADGVFLGAKSSKEIMVDSVTVGFPRRQDSGMGILLEEIAGGREDGLGITIVSGLVEGGAADGSGILPGDSVSKIAIKKRNKDSGGVGLSEVDETLSISTECLGYDATVDQILSLPECESDDEIFLITVKRLRRKPRVTVNLQFPPSQEDQQEITLELFSGENLRRAMLTRGVKMNDAMSRRFDSGGMGDCGAEGTCATCVVNVVEGGDLLNQQSIQESQILKKNPKWRMACKAIVGYGFKEGEMTLRVNPRQWDS